MRSVGRPHNKRHDKNIDAQLRYLRSQNTKELIFKEQLAQ